MLENYIFYSVTTQKLLESHFAFLAVKSINLYIIRKIVINKKIGIIIIPNKIYMPHNLLFRIHNGRSYFALFKIFKIQKIKKRSV